MERFEHGGNVYAHSSAIDFSASLNPLGMPTSARETLRTHVDACAAYPDPHCTALVEAIAAFEGVDPRWVVPCAGATDAFARLCQAIRPADALVCTPCYSGYEQALEQVGATVRFHALAEESDFAPGPSIARAIGASTATLARTLVFLANPNNPTGRCLPSEVLRACLSQAEERGALVVLDECFIDLSEQAGSNELLATNPHLVIVKALTKTFALAGLRVGYALCADVSLVERLRAAGQPWAVSVPAQLTGVAALEDADYLQRSRSLIAVERARLDAALKSLSCHVVPSDTNFLLFRAPLPLTEALLARGILVRPCDNFRGLDPRWHRIAVRTPEENARLIDALREVIA